MISWPTDLPTPQRTSLSIGRGDSRIPTRADRGPQMFKRGWSNVEDTVERAILVDYDQRYRFEQFYDDDTRRGNVPFAIPDHSMDGVPLMTEGGLFLFTEDVVPILMDAWWFVMFGSMPVTTRVGRHFRISFTLLVLPL